MRGKKRGKVFRASGWNFNTDFVGTALGVCIRALFVANIGSFTEALSLARN